MSSPLTHGMKTTRDVLTEMFLRHGVKTREDFLFHGQIMANACSDLPKGVDKNKLKVITIRYVLESDVAPEVEDTDEVKPYQGNDPADYVHSLFDKGWHVYCAYPIDVDEKKLSFTLVIKFFFE